MLLNLNKVNWNASLRNRDFVEEHKKIEETMKSMAKLTAEYNKWI